jgi:hypothetical protein
MTGPAEPSDSTVVPNIACQDDIGVPVKTGLCPQCGCERGCVRVTPFQWSGERHLNWYCPCCRHVWVRPERRRQHRIHATHSPAPAGLTCPVCRNPAIVKAVTARGVIFCCPSCNHDWDNRSANEKVE